MAESGCGVVLKIEQKNERMSEPDIPFLLLLAIHLRAKTQSERNGSLSFLTEKEEQCLKYQYRLGCLINEPTFIAQVSRTASFYQMNLDGPGCIFAKLSFGLNQLSYNNNIIISKDDIEEKADRSSVS